MSRERRNAAAIGTAVFVSGGVLLGVELAASRVLAPFFGNSIFVWGALIGVVLAGLSAGYWMGGVLADRIPAPQLLLACSRSVPPRLFSFRSSTGRCWRRSSSGIRGRG